MGQGRVRVLLDRQVEKLVAAVGAEGEARRALVKTAAEVGAAVRTPWRIRSTRSAVTDAARRGLDAMAGVVARHPAPIDDVAALEQRASEVRRGVAAALIAVQGVLVTTTAATDGLGGPPSLVVDAGIAQVAAVLTGLAEWYLVGSYAVALMRRAGIEPEGHHLRPIVNAALLSGARTLDTHLAVAEAEGRLIGRWIGRGVLDAVPFVSAYPNGRARRAGERLGAMDPRSWPGG